jgi:hypothetical protein
MKRSDPIVDKIHKIREKFGREHGFDVRCIARALQEQEAEHPQKLVSRSPKRVPRKKAS